MCYILKKILIIGGAGYVGSVLIKEFLEQGYEVIVLDLLKRGSDGIKEHEKSKRFYFINADYMSEILPKTLKIYEPDIVIHLAAIVGDKACKEDPELATKTNVEGIHWLVECCNGTDALLLIASTCSIYGTNPNTCTEDSVIFPISHYAKTKREMEQIVKEKSKFALIFRFGTMYGWSPNMRYDLVVNRLVYDSIHFQEFKIFGGKQVRPFLHPKDLAYFFMRLCMLKDKLSKFNGEIFNLVSENLSIEELGELIEAVIPYVIKKEEDVKEVERSYCCRCFKAYKHLGFKPRVRVRDGIQEIEKKLLKREITYSRSLMKGKPSVPSPPFEEVDTRRE